MYTYSTFPLLEKNKLYRLPRGSYILVDYLDNISCGTIYYASVEDYQLDQLLDQGFKRSTGNNFYSMVIFKERYPELEPVNFDN